nr:hypothetical protein [Kofleriaceae bacterium]
MLRLVACVLALSACDAVYGLANQDVEAQPCGPYGPATPVQFAAGLSSPHDFSLGSDLSHGSVVQSIGASTIVTAVALGSGGVWDVDGDRDMNIPGGPNSGRIVGDGDLYSTETGDATRLDQRTFEGSSSQWASDGVVLVDARFDLDIGNVVTPLGSDGTPQEHVGVVLERTKDLSQAVSTLVAIRRAQPFSSNNWKLDADLIAPLTNDGNLAAVGQGVLTLDRQALIYAASYTPGGDLDLFISARDSVSGEFPTGTRLDSVSVDGVDDSAPSIDAACTTIVFERGDQTLMATSTSRGSGSSE